MGHQTHSGSHDHGHVVPASVFLNVLIVLMILTVITVAVSRVDLGAWNIVVAMIVASIKAGIVGLFFMHLKYENPMIWAYVAFPLILLVIMIGGLLIDNPNRTDPKIYADQPKKAESAVKSH
jgi:cytochrome c oxidase subunit IV